MRRAVGRRGIPAVQEAFLKENRLKWEGGRCLLYYEKSELKALEINFGMA